MKKAVIVTKSKTVRKGASVKEVSSLDAKTSARKMEKLVMKSNSPKKPIEFIEME